MIRFGKNDKVENLGILTSGEARSYVCFLGIERIRHRVEKAISWIFSKLFGRQASKLLWKSAIRRHKKDVEEIDVLVKTLKGFYGI